MATKSNAEEEDETAAAEMAMYIIVNHDLKMGAGKIASQCCHSACAVITRLERTLPKCRHYQSWERNAHAKIILKATEGEMHDILQLFNVTNECVDVVNDNWCVAIRDLGRTQIQSGSLTTLAFRPFPKHLAPKIIKKLKLR